MVPVVSFTMTFILRRGMDQRWVTGVAGSWLRVVNMLGVIGDWVVVVFCGTISVQRLSVVWKV